MLNETYNGCKIRVRAGRKADFGKMFALLNGESVPCYEKRDEHKAMAEIKRFVDEVNSQPVDGSRWAASYYAPGTYEMCPEGMHPQTIGGECLHPCCVERRGDVPAELCAHGIDAARPGLCSICREDAQIGEIEDTDGRCPYGNIHAIETCQGCGTEDEQGNQITEAPKVGQKYRRADGDVVELKAVFPLDRSIAYLIVEAPNHAYRQGLRGTVSFSGLSQDFELVTEDQAPKVSIHTAGELHPAPSIESRFTFTFNLSDLLDDPAHKPGAELIELDGTHEDVQAFVFESEGAIDLFWSIVSLIEGQVRRGKSVTVLILCRGGKHRSVAFGECLASTFSARTTHHHKHLPRVVS